MAGAEREAVIRIAVRKEGAVEGFRAVRREAEDFTRNVRGGLDDARRSAVSLTDSLRQGVGMAAGFFGIHAGLGLVKDAQRIKREFTEMAFSMEAGGRGLKNWKSLMGEVWAVNRRWGQEVHALTRVYRDLNEEIGGSPDEIAKVLSSVAKAATASGKPVETLGNLGAVLAEKWELPSEKMDDALRSVLSLTSQGGVRLEEFVGQAGRLGPKIRKAGMTGDVDTLSKLLGTMNRAEQASRTPRMGAMALGNLIELLSGETVERRATLLKAGVSGTEINKIKDPLEMMRTIVDATGGKRESIERAFGRTSPQSDILNELARPYLEAVGQLGPKASAKEKQAVGLAAYDEAVARSASVSLSRERFDELASERANDGEAGVNRAMANLTEAVANPALLKGLTELANAFASATKTIGEAGEFLSKKLGLGDPNAPPGAPDGSASPWLVGGGLLGGVGALKLAGGYLGGLGAKLAGGGMVAAGGGTVAAGGAAAGSGGVVAAALKGAFAGSSVLAGPAAGAMAMLAVLGYGKGPSVQGATGAGNMPLDEVLGSSGGGGAPGFGEGRRMREEAILSEYEAIRGVEPIVGSRGALAGLQERMNRGARARLGKRSVDRQEMIDTGTNMLDATSPLLGFALHLAKSGAPTNYGSMTAAGVGSRDQTVDALRQAIEDLYPRERGYRGAPGDSIGTRTDIDSAFRALHGQPMRVEVINPQAFKTGAGL